MASAGLLAIIQGLRRAGAKAIEKRALRDAEDLAAPGVHRPTDELSLDPELNVGGEAPTFFGPTSSQLDRHPEVLNRFDEIRADNPNVRFQGTVEQQLDEIERNLIDEGVLRDIDIEPSARKPSEYEPTKSSRLGKPDARADEEAIKKELGFIPREKYTKAQEGKPQDLRASKEIPRQDDIDLTNERQEAILQRRIKELQEQPEINTPANEEILASQVIGEDALDKASGKFFGRGPKYKIQPDDNFTLRDLEDTFVKGRDAEGNLSSRIINPDTPEEQLIGNTPQARAVLALKARGTTASQGRSTGPGDARRIPTGKRSFERQKLITGEELDEPQEALTGRLRPDVALEQAQVKANALALRADLKAIRTGTNELTPRQEALRDLFTSGEKPTKKAVQAIFEEFPVDKAKFPLTPDPGRQVTAPSAAVARPGEVAVGRQAPMLDAETGKIAIDEATGNQMFDIVDQSTPAPDAGVVSRTPEQLSEARRIIASQGGVDLTRNLPKPTANPNPDLQRSLLQALREIQGDFTIGPRQVNPDLAFKTKPPPQRQPGPLDPSINQFINIIRQLKLQQRTPEPVSGLPRQPMAQNPVAIELEKRFRKLGIGR